MSFILNFNHTETYFTQEIESQIKGKILEKIILKIGHTFLLTNKKKTFKIL